MNCSCGHPIQAHHYLAGCGNPDCTCDIIKSDFVDGLETRLAEAETLMRLLVESDDFQNECGCPVCGYDHNHAPNCKLAAWLGV